MDQQQRNQAALVHTLVTSSSESDQLMLMADGSYIWTGANRRDGAGPAPVALSVALAVEFSEEPNVFISLDERQPDVWPIVLEGKTDSNGQCYVIEFLDDKTWRLGRKAGPTLEYPPNLEGWFHANAPAVRRIVSMVIAVQYPEGVVNVGRTRGELLAEAPAKPSEHVFLPHTAANLNFTATKYDGLEGVITVDVHSHGEMIYARAHGYKIQGKRLTLELATATRTMTEDNKVEWHPLRPRELVMQDVMHVLGMVSSICPAFPAVSEMSLGGAAVFAFNREDQLTITKHYPHIQLFPHGSAPLSAPLKSDLLETPTPQLAVFEKTT